LIVVSNTSPLIALSAIGRLELLHALYDHILIPGAVQQEVVGSGLGRPGGTEIQTAAWVSSHPVKGEFLPRALAGELGRGEAEAIALALERRADLLLIDERRGRKVAGRFGVRVLGVLGILIDAKGKGLIPEVGPALEDLLTKAGFRISKALHQRALEEAEEA
jgi:predicted nucleic acid-binding protein